MRRMQTRIFIMRLDQYAEGNLTYFLSSNFNTENSYEFVCILTRFLKRKLIFDFKMKKTLKKWFHTWKNRDLYLVFILDESDF